MRPPHPAPSDRTRLRRLPDKAAYDRATINAILDAQPLAQIGHLIDGAPCVTPTLQWREGDHVYFHGSSASRMIRAATHGAICLSVTRLDGLVLARSGLEHSVNFRAVTVFGMASPVTDPAAKEAHLRVMIDRMFPGRWDQLRPITAQELKATAILSLPLTEASAKIGAGGPTDPPEDMTWPVWAGIAPITETIGQMTAEPGLAADLPLPRITYGQPE